MAHTIDTLIQAAEATIPRIPKVNTEIQVTPPAMPVVEQISKVNVDISGAIDKIQGITESPECQENMANIRAAAATARAIIGN